MYNHEFFFFFTELMKAVEDCMNNPHPETFQMSHMFDVGAWVEGTCGRNPPPYQTSLFQIYKERSWQSGNVLPKVEWGRVDGSYPNAQGRC